MGEAPRRHLRTSKFSCGPVAQWIEQGTPKPLVGGSIPSGPARFEYGRGFSSLSSFRRGCDAIFATTGFVETKVVGHTCGSAERRRADHCVREASSVPDTFSKVAGNNAQLPHSPRRPGPGRLRGPLAAAFSDAGVIVINAKVRPLILIASLPSASPRSRLPPMSTSTSPLSTRRSLSPKSLPVVELAGWAVRLSSARQHTGNTRMVRCAWASVGAVR